MSPAGTVDLLVDEARRLPHVRHHEARVVPRRAVAEADDFRLDHHPARTIPRARRITGVGVDVRRLPTLLTLRPRDLHGRLGVPHQHRVLRHRHHVVEPRLGIQEVEELRGRETAVEPHEKPHPRKRRPQQGQQPTQQADGPVRGHRLSGAQHRRAQILLHLAVEGQERQLRQVTPRAIVPVEERELLRAVRPVVGRVQVDRDTPRPPVQPLPMPLDDASRQLPSHPVEGGATHVVDAVTVIWGVVGEAFQPNGLLSTAGKDQFRLSVVLNRNALTRLWDENFEFSGRGHVKRSSGSSASIYDTDSAREPGGLPKLQVSWLRDDPRIGEIDIDYRSLRSLPHLNPENSDVRGSLRGNPHYCLHRAKYDDSRQKLVDWWNSEPEQCGE